MSAEVRQAIASAASTVDGADVAPYHRQLTRPGDGVVRKDRVEYPNPFGGVATWQVLVMVPDDLAAAQRYLDDQVPALVAAVQQELAVTSVTPGVYPAGTKSVPVVAIEGHREEE